MLRRMLVMAGVLGVLGFQQIAPSVALVSIEVPESIQLLADGNDYNNGSGGG